jgi:hypothetical protein
MVRYVLVGYTKLGLRLQGKVYLSARKWLSEKKEIINEE